MALDGIYLSLLRKEFDPLIDGRVDKIHQPSREELIMTIRTKEGELHYLEVLHLSPIFLAIQEVCRFYHFLTVHYF